MKTLLVPLDTSSVAEKVLATAVPLARSFGAKVVLLHVIEPVATYVPVGAGMDVIATPPPPEVDDGQAAASKARLEELAGPLRAAGIGVACEAFIGLAVDEILEMADSLGADYIVLGSHGHGALYHLFSGSVVTGVLKHARCPVIVVPAHQGARVPGA
jgi:nucleotide-binding universal stress UspA family protein